MSVTKESVVVLDGIITATPIAGASGTFNVTWTGTAFVHLAASDPASVPEPKRAGAASSCESDKAFSVSGTAKPVDGSTDGDLFKKYVISFTDGDGWDVEPGKKIKDKSHDVLCSLQWRGSPDGSDSLCYAKGEDEFGTFISVGYMKPGNRITLARRHLDASDSRAAWSPEDIQKEIIKAIYSEEEEDITVSPPWKCDVLKVQ